MTWSQNAVFTVYVKSSEYECPFSSILLKILDVYQKGISPDRLRLVYDNHMPTYITQTPAIMVEDRRERVMAVGREVFELLANHHKEYDNHTPTPAALAMAPTTGVDMDDFPTQLGERMPDKGSMPAAAASESWSGHRGGGVGGAGIAHDVPQWEGNMRYGGSKVAGDAGFITDPGGAMSAAQLEQDSQRMMDNRAQMWDRY